MADVKNKIQGAIGQVFDVLRKNVFFDTTDTLTLLKPSAVANTFIDVYTVPDSWFFEYDGFNKAFRLKISASSQALTDAFAVATHIRVISVENNTNAVYAIRDGDTQPPLGTNMFWKALCERPAQRGGFTELY